MKLLYFRIPGVPICDEIGIKLENLKSADIKIITVNALKPPKSKRKYKVTTAPTLIEVNPDKTAKEIRRITGVGILSQLHDFVK